MDVLFNDRFIRGSQSVSNQKRTFKGFEWNFFESIGRGKVKLLTEGTGVYMITVKREGWKQRKLVYIGCSKNLYKRLYNHPVLDQLKYSRTDYIIEVLFRDFGGLLKNREMECILINKHIPPFNYPKRNNTHNEMKEFSRSLGVKYILGRWKIKYPL